MARPKLKVKKRKLSGRKVKKLRREGILPANIYGKKVKSQAVQLELAKFLPIYRKAGETGLVDLLIEGSKTIRPVLVHNVQFNPVTDQIIHADFHQVSLTEKIKAEIPIEIVGESPAMVQKQGILVRLLDEIEVEALATDLPEKIEVDVSSLEKAGEMIKVGQIKFDKKVSVVTDLSRLIVKIEPPTKVEEEKPPPEEEVPEGEEVPAEGEAPAEGARPEPVEGKKPEISKEKERKETHLEAGRGKPAEVKKADKQQPEKRGEK